MIFTYIQQIYIVAGGSSTSTVETLVKNGGTSWLSVANLPSSIHGLTGVGLHDAQFIVTGKTSLFNPSMVLLPPVQFLIVFLRIECLLNRFF